MKKSIDILSRLELENKRENHSHSHPSKRCEKFANRQTVRSQQESKQLCLFTESEISKKAQISSSPGVSIRRRDRYRVTLAGEVLADGLTNDEALKLANQLNRLRKRRKLTDSLNLLESCGIVSQETQIFVLSKIGAMRGES